MVPCGTSGIGCVWPTDHTRAAEYSRQDAEPGKGPETWREKFEVYMLVVIVMIIF